MSKASVLIFRGVSEPYDYFLPDHLNLQVGDHVLIPLGRQTVTGLVLTISNNANPSLKAIVGLDENYLSIPNEIVDLLIWFYQYYLCTPYKAYQTIVGNRLIQKKPASAKITVPLATIKCSPFTLTEGQRNAFEIIQESPPGSEILMVGVTGSGKTEVYLRCAEAALQKNQSALILLPEIALTPQTRRHFESRFGDVVSVIHSGLTPKKRNDEWEKIRLGTARVVIGPRSAVFCPLSDIGIIIIDEAHDGSYKQENHPRYATLTVARRRQLSLKCKLVTGSATPDLADFYDSTHFQNRQVVYLSERVNQQSLPPIEIINFREEIQNEKTGIFSPRLLSEIESTLARNEKAMILVNRRGYAPYICCTKCGKVATCPTCNLSYTFHQDHSFRCHRCFTKTPATRTCPSCKKSGLVYGGLGIQKVEIELRKLYPDISICRVDKDSAGTVKKLESLLSEFAKSGQLMIGTQMIAKGHHFPEVTLVGVIGIDTLLNIPDFRAPERVFQLLTQVSGRAGRGDKPGKVMIQTLQPEHYAIRHASLHDFNSFYKEEIQYREPLRYPPFSRLINFIISSKSNTEAQKYAAILQQHLVKGTASNLSILGPVPAPFEKINDYFRYHLLIKISGQPSQLFDDLIRSIPSPNMKVRCIPDIDPMSIL